MLGALTQLIDESLEGFSPTSIILGTLALPVANALYQREWREDLRWIQDKAFKIAPKIPFIGSKFQHEIDKKFEPAMDEMDQDIHKKRNLVYKSLPREGIDKKVLLEQIKKDCDFSEIGDKMSGAIYRSLMDRDLDSLNAEIFGLAAYTNPLHAGAWPNLAQREAEVLAWCSALFQGDDTMCGSITNGGTFSIMEACRTYKEWAKKEKGITRPNMVVPATVHAAFDKAAQDYGIKLIKVPVDPKTQIADVKAMSRKINKNTIAIVGSAPSYPTGTIDPIKALSELALKHHIGCHVDACLGGLLLPFAKDAGKKLPAFDFSLEGVSSMSLDPHKYGQTAKGSSLVLMRKKFGIHQPYVFLDSPIGMYITPNQAGSRCGANILMTWATLAHIGGDNYVDITKRIINLREKIADEIKQISDLNILGTPLLSVIAFDAKDLNIYLISEKMKAKGWHLNNIQNPAGTHLCLTAKHLEDPQFSAIFIQDLKECVQYVKDHPHEKPKGEGAVYATLGSIPAVISPQLKEKLGQEYYYLSTRIQPTRVKKRERAQEQSPQEVKNPRPRRPRFTNQ